MRKIEAYYPEGKFCSLEIPHNRNISIYESVEVFKKRSNPKIILKKSAEYIPLKSIINLHNNDGIQSLERIKSMIKDIISGKDIFSSDGFPNIKLVKTEDNEWILFDGHHTMLAYIIMGREFLHEVPHMIIKNQDKEHVNSEEISVFFGEHADKIKNWKEHVINWQAEKEKQLCKRVQNNVGELFESIKRIL
ncbi:hypothetical protein KY343_01630 [Candidatus Woesearchaeota archaeon]|nr:hypothetical protein [Candidatus Woesearchaeota archaeon]